MTEAESARQIEIRRLRWSQVSAALLAGFLLMLSLQTWIRAEWQQSLRVGDLEQHLKALIPAALLLAFSLGAQRHVLIQGVLLGLCQIGLAGYLVVKTSESWVVNWQGRELFGFIPLAPQQLGVLVLQLLAYANVGAGALALARTSQRLRAFLNLDEAAAAGRRCSSLPVWLAFAVGSSLAGLLSLQVYWIF